MRVRFVTYGVIALVLVVGSMAYAQAPTEDDEYSGVPLCANPFNPSGPGIGVTGYYALQAEGQIGGVRTVWIGVANFSNLGTVTVNVSQVQDTGRIVFTDTGRAHFTRNCLLGIDLANHPLEGVRISTDEMIFQTTGPGQVLSGRLTVIKPPRIVNSSTIW